jgi:transcription termination factor NusB
MVKAIVKLQLLDVVAIKEDLPDANLLAGQVGTIVEVLAPEVYEVEFSDDDGQTYAMLPLHSSQLLQLKYKSTAENTPMSNTIHQYGQEDNVAGDNVEGDKVGRDKVDNSQANNLENAKVSGVISRDNAQVSNSQFNQNNNANTAELLQLISSMRQTADEFPEDIREGIIIDIEDIETEIQKPENQWNKSRLKKSLKAIVAAVTAIAIPIAGMTYFANTAIELGQKVGVELKLPPGH